jgi:hypothetical protein
VGHWPPLLADRPSDRLLKRTIAKLPRSRIVSRSEFARYRFLFHMPGSTQGSYSRNMQIALGVGSVVLKWDNPFYEFFYRTLTPWVHYVPVNASNAVAVVARLTGDDALAQRIVDLRFGDDVGNVAVLDVVLLRREEDHAVVGEQQHDAPAAAAWQAHTELAAAAWLLKSPTGVVSCGCGALYCSRACADADVARGHRLLCEGEGRKAAADLRAWRSHAEGTELPELELAARLLVARLCADAAVAQQLEDDSAEGAAVGECGGEELLRAKDVVGGTKKGYVFLIGEGRWEKRP